MALKGGVKLQAHLVGIAKKLSNGESVRVGFLEGEKYPDGTNVAQAAYWNECGTTNAPPRPFFRNTIAEKSDRWGAALGVNLTANDYDAVKALSAVGEGIKGQIVKSIVDFKAPGNAGSTIAKKGFDKPLIDTGQMQRAVDFEVKDGGQ